MPLQPPYRICALIIIKWTLLGDGKEIFLIENSLRGYLKFPDKEFVTVGSFYLRFFFFSISSVHLHILQIASEERREGIVCAQMNPSMMSGM